MSRFYVRPENRKRDKIYVDKKEAHHILDVMRLKKDDEVTAFDGTGREYTGFIESVTPKSLVISINSVREKTDGTSRIITLAQAVPKKDKMDYIIQKAAELGVSSIIPMDTQRTVVKLSRDKISSRLRRWKCISREAAKQCGRSRVADIEGYLGFSDALKKARLYDLALMPSVGDVKRQSLKNVLSGFHGRSILIFIGPEGGFSPAELSAASKSGAVFVSLGENVLKCDTAAIAAISMVNYALDET